MRITRCLVLVGMMLITFCPQAISQYTEELEEQPIEQPIEQPVEPLIDLSSQAYPIAEIDRPLTLPEMILEPRGEMDIDILGDTLGDQNWVSLRAGAGLGIIDNVEAGMSVPLSMAPKGKLGDLQMYGMYELETLLEGKLHSAGRLTMTIPLSKTHPHWAGMGFMMLADAPIKFRLHEKFAAIGGLGMGFMTTRNDGPSYFLLNADFGALVQPTEQLAVSLQMGIHGYIGDNGDVLVPLSLRGQYTLMGNLDFFMDLGFIDLNNASGDWVQVLFGASFRMGV